MFVFPLRHRVLFKQGVFLSVSLSEQAVSKQRRQQQVVSKHQSELVLSELNLTECDGRRTQQQEVSSLLVWSDRWMDKDSLFVLTLGHLTSLTTLCLFFI